MSRTSVEKLNIDYLLNEKVGLERKLATCRAELKKKKAIIRDLQPSTVTAIRALEGIISRQVEQCRVAETKSASFESALDILGVSLKFGGGIDVDFDKFVKAMGSESCLSLAGIIAERYKNVTSIELSVVAKG